MKSHQLINQDSKKVEYYTPVEIIEAARRVLGEIDLDPASSIAANKTVRAKVFYKKEDDGLSKNWNGRVWMNHPFGRNENRKWISKLEIEFTSGRVSEALCITFASTSEKWFLPLLERPQALLTKRTNFLDINGNVIGGATKGCVVTYFGLKINKFEEEFNQLAIVKIRI